MPELTAHKPITPRVKPQRLTATLTYKENLASKFNYFEFQTEGPFDFDAGQYVNTLVAEHTYRAYSIATRPAEDKFGLLVDTRPGGPGSQFYESIEVGKVIEFLGPLGIFIIRPEDGAHNILLLGTGSGISPLRCIVDDELLNKKSDKNIYLYMGLTKTSEIFWNDYFEDLASKHENFHYKLAIYDPEESWTGHKGYNTELMLQDFPDTCDCAAYLCGHPAMIKGAKELLQKTGCPDMRIYEEKFFAQ